ncbi:NUDIX hydrolase [Enterocloster asparagiformis]|uniref:NUDIX hydrolase n=1 Tax=Enterocloster asparagiformis TaxID=333367 RepID=UPI0034AD115F
MSRNFPEKLDRKVIYESDWISLYTDRVRMPDGEIIESYHRLHYPYESVCVVICNARDEFLLIRSKRYTTGRIEWEIPAGRVEEGESPVEAAKRECFEETGCVTTDLTFLCTQNPSNGMSDLAVHNYLGKVERETDCFDENEVDGKQWIKRETVLEMLRKNEIFCGASMLALMYAIQFYMPENSR